MNGFPAGSHHFEVTEGERIEDGPGLRRSCASTSAAVSKRRLTTLVPGMGWKLLSDFQPDIIKIDMDLVRHVDTNRPRQTIVRNRRGCVKRWHHRDCEGIETLGERDFCGRLWHPAHAGLPVCQARAARDGALREEAFAPALSSPAGGFQGLWPRPPANRKAATRGDLRARLGYLK